MMQTRILWSLSLMAGLTAPLAISEPPATPKPRTSTQRVVLARGASYLGVGVVEISPERAKELHLTNAGEKRLQAALKAWSQAQAQFETSFGTKRAAELRALLRSVAASEFTAESAKHIDGLHSASVVK